MLKNNPRLITSIDKFFDNSQLIQFSKRILSLSRTFSFLLNLLCLGFVSLPTSLGMTRNLPEPGVGRNGIATDEIGSRHAAFAGGL